MEPEIKITTTDPLASPNTSAVQNTVTSSLASATINPVKEAVPKEYALRAAQKGLLLILKSSGIALGCFVLLIFTGNKIHETVARVTTMRGELAAFTAKYEQFDKLKKNHEEIKGSLVKLESIIPSFDNVVIVIDYITSLGIQTENIVTAQFNQNPVLAEGGNSEIGFSLQVTGTLSSLTALLSKIENAPYLIVVRAVSFTITNPTSSALTAQLSGALYARE